MLEENISLERRMQLDRLIIAMKTVPLDEVLECIISDDPIVSLAGTYYYKKHYLKMSDYELGVL